MPERMVEVQWGSQGEARYQVAISVLTGERQGLLRDVTTIIANEKVNVLDMSSRFDAKQRVNIMEFKLEVRKTEDVNRLMAKINQLDDVISVERQHH